MMTLLHHPAFARHPAFTLWRLEPHKEEGKKPLKVPVWYDGITHHSIRYERPAPPLTAEQAQQWLAHNRATGVGHDRPNEIGYLGIGFRPTPENRLTCLDLDGCIDAEGNPTPEARQWLAYFNGAAVERSHSGRGLHIWFTYQGEGPGKRGKKKTAQGELELYGDGQFIALGEWLGGDPIDCTPQLQGLLQTYWPVVEERNRSVTAPDWETKSAEERAATLADLRAALFHPGAYDPDVFDDWISAGQALSSLGETGFALWAEWSATSEKYPGGSDLERWNTFTGDRTDYRAVLARAQRVGWVNPRRGPSAAEVFQAPASLPAGAVTDPAAVSTHMPGTEAALAADFVKAARGVVAWSPRLGWMMREGAIWAPDDTLVSHRLMRTVCNNAGLGMNSTTLQRLGKASTVSAALKEAQSDPEIQAKDGDWDKDPLELNTPTGVVDLRNATLRPHEAGDRFLKCTRVGLRDGVPARWLQFLVETFGSDADMIEFMQRSAGYWATGSIKAKAFWYLYGPGDTGKSVLMDTLLHVLGTYGHILAPDALVERKGGNKHPESLAMLEGKRLASTAELPDGAHLDQALLKTLTGDEKISARGMRENSRDIFLTQKHVMTSNHLARLPGGDRALRRRLLLVEFKRSVPIEKQDPELVEKLRAEGPQILAWVVAGAAKWWANGGGVRGLGVPASVRQAAADYLEDEDDIVQWMAECCDLGPEHECVSGDAYASFKAWKFARGEGCPGVRTWSLRLQGRPDVQRSRSSTARLYRGFRLKPA